MARWALIKLCIARDFDSINRCSLVIANESLFVPTGNLPPILNAFAKSLKSNACS